MGAQGGGHHRGPCVTLGGWKLTYAGRPDAHAVSGVAAPSWHTFDRRVWRMDDYELELTNLQKKVPGKIATYKVTVRRGESVVIERESHDWTALVRDVKAEVSLRRP